MSLHILLLLIVLAFICTLVDSHEVVEFLTFKTPRSSDSASVNEPADIPVIVKRELLQQETVSDENYEINQNEILIDSDEYHREVNEQTLRMMHAQLSHILFNKSNNQVNLREFDYFRKARLVVEKLCPSEFVPENLVQGLMRMFEQLIWESLLDYGPQNQNPDDAQFDRIMNILDHCTEDIAQTDRFAFYNYTGSFDFANKNETDPDWPQPEQCPEPLIYGVWGKGQDGEYSVLHNVTGGFSPHLKFNLTLVDFVIETAWKIVMIAHYQCSKSFNDTTAGDFATFFHQMEIFFNEQVIKRWYDPLSVDKTLQILKLIFPTYNLKKFAFGIDICLFATQQFTDFGWNSKWIQRPKLPFKANQLSQNRHIIPGLSQDPISTNDYAPKMYEREIIKSQFYSMHPAG